MLYDLLGKARADVRLTAANCMGPTWARKPRNAPYPTFTDMAIRSLPHLHMPASCGSPFHAYLHACWPPYREIAMYYNVNPYLS